MSILELKIKFTFFEISKKSIKNEFQDSFKYSIENIKEINSLNLFKRNISSFPLKFYF